MKHLQKLPFFILSFQFICGLSVKSQNIGINETGANPHPSSILDISSNDKGFLPPRLTTLQRNSITTPAKGLVIYNIDADC